MTCKKRLQMSGDGCLVEIKGTNNYSVLMQNEIITKSQVSYMMTPCGNNDESVLSVITLCKNVDIVITLAL